MAFSGIDHLYRQVLKDKKDISKRDIQNFLNGKFVYAHHKPYRKTYQTRKTWVHSPGVQYQADLVDMQKFVDQNDGYRYIVSIIDCFSRVLHMYPVKNKGGIEVTKIFKEWYEDIGSPKHLIKMHFDQGREFMNKNLMKWFGENVIEYFSTHTDKKAALVERVQKTIKNRMYKYFTSRGVNYKRWIDVLNDLVQNYNNTYHTTLKMKPVEVADRQNEAYLNIYHSDIDQKPKTPKFKLNEEVKVQAKPTAFRRGYLANFSRSPYFIDEVLKTNPATYRLRDYDGKKAKGTYYNEQLVAFDNPEKIYEVEKIIKTRTRKGKREMLVRWAGYSEQQDSWISEKDLKNM